MIGFNSRPVSTFEYARTAAFCSLAGGSKFSLALQDLNHQYALHSVRIKSVIRFIYKDENLLHEILVFQEDQYQYPCARDDALKIEYLPGPRF